MSNAAVEENPSQFHSAGASSPSNPPKKTVLQRLARRDPLSINTPKPVDRSAFISTEHIPAQTDAGSLKLVLPSQSASVLSRISSVGEPRAPAVDQFKSVENTTPSFALSVAENPLASQRSRESSLGLQQQDLDCSSSSSQQVPPNSGPGSPDERLRALISTADTPPERPADLQSPQENRNEGTLNGKTEATAPPPQGISPLLPSDSDGAVALAFLNGVRRDFEVNKKASYSGMSVTPTNVPPLVPRAVRRLRKGPDFVLGDSAMATPGEVSAVKVELTKASASRSTFPLHKCKELVSSLVAQNQSLRKRGTSSEYKGEKETHVIVDDAFCREFMDLGRLVQKQTSELKEREQKQPWKGPTRTTAPEQSSLAAGKALSKSPAKKLVMHDPPRGPLAMRKGGEGSESQFRHRSTSAYGGEGSFREHSPPPRRRARSRSPRPPHIIVGARRSTRSPRLRSLSSRRRLPSPRRRSPSPRYRSGRRSPSPRRRSYSRPHMRPQDGPSASSRRCGYSPVRSPLPRKRPRSPSPQRSNQFSSPVRPEQPRGRSRSPSPLYGDKTKKQKKHVGGLSFDLEVPSSSPWVEKSRPFEGNLITSRERFTSGSPMDVDQSFGPVRPVPPLGPPDVVIVDEEIEEIHPRAFEQSSDPAHHPSPPPQNGMAIDDEIQGIPPPIIVSLPSLKPVTSWFGGEISEQPMGIAEPIVKSPVPSLDYTAIPRVHFAKPGLSTPGVVEVEFCLSEDEARQLRLVSVVKEELDKIAENAALAHRESKNPGELKLDCCWPTGGFCIESNRGQPHACTIVPQSTRPIDMSRCLRPGTNTIRCIGLSGAPNVCYVLEILYPIPMPPVVVDRNAVDLASWAAIHCASKVIACL